MKAVCFFTLVLLAASPFLRGTDPAAATKPKPKATNSFGIKPEGIATPEMAKALETLHEAGTVEGRRGSLTFFRWTNDEPPKLAHLGLWGPKIDDTRLSLVAHLPDLEFVSLYETRVTDAGLAALAKLPRLRAVSVTPIIRYEKAGFGAPQWSYPFMRRIADRPRITGAGLATLTKLPTIESLDLLDAVIAPVDLAALAALPKLSSLALPGGIDAATVAHLQACRRLSTLTLGHREIEAHEIEALAAWKSLRRLNVLHATLSDEALQTFSMLESVEELRLEDCGLTDDRLRHLAPSPKLTALILERNEIDGPGLVHLVRLKLKTLGVEFNNLDNTTLAHLPQLTSLEQLWLAYNRRITDAGIRSGTLQGMTHLKQLRLRGLPAVTDASLADLERFGHLTNLTIRETKISAEGVARLQKAMPQTEVFK